MISPTAFEKLIEGLSSREIISAAIACGYLETKTIPRGYETQIPRWLAEILSRKGIVELIEVI
jgi:hypothetical protein